MDTIKIRSMILRILEEVDQDKAKFYDLETSENPDGAEEAMTVLVSIVKEYVGKK